MIRNSKSPIEKEIDRLFAEPDAEDHNPVTGAVNWVREPMGPQKRAALVPLLAREWLAIHGPRDAPLLPLSHDEIDCFRNARGLMGLVGFYARSLARQGWDVRKHPSFEDFCCGLMAIDTGMWGIENDEDLKRRFPPRPLEGMTPFAFWASPEEHDEIMASQKRTRRAA